jgi:signal peptidase I
LKYVKRLVGLPGEAVFIKDGAIWVNGAKLDPPESVRHVKYAPHGDIGLPENPWKLQQGECIVLGDFPQIAADSRYFGIVPDGNIEGVVTVRYWPYSRWHIWR